MRINCGTSVERQKGIENSCHAPTSARSGRIRASIVMRGLRARRRGGNHAKSRARTCRTLRIQVSWQPCCWKWRADHHSPRKRLRAKVLRFTPRWVLKNLKCQIQTSGENSCKTARRAHSGNPAFRRPSICRCEFDCPPRAIHLISQRWDRPQADEPPPHEPRHRVQDGPKRPPNRGKLPHRMSADEEPSWKPRLPRRNGEARSTSNRCQ